MRIDAELDKVCQYTGDQQKLGKAEQFFTMISSTLRWETRLELFIFKSEFPSYAEELHDHMSRLITNCTLLTNSKCLEELFNEVMKELNIMILILILIMILSLDR